ncbi:MAG TPA: 2-C-methyl-D-erythritol 4-phosphate cytidylyltransferase, partial [Sphingomonas sp.]|nr:2-C-methyl-D-erythritol 4-phosphate cytidylyltransferase [Sphingomonas sp.]
MKTVAIIVAAGSGTRAGGSVPKQFAPLAGKPMLAHSYAAMTSHPAIDTVLVVIGEGQEAGLRAAVGEVDFVVGGASRRESVANGLAAIGDADRVLIHDAARPFLHHAVIDRLLAALETAPGAIPGLPVADTLVSASGASVSREGLVRVQTPQAFRGADIAEAHAAWPADEEATDDAQMVRTLGKTVSVVEGSAMLEKITHPADFAAAEARYGAAMRVRTATGYDVHRFAEGEELWLGGVKIPHSRGLSGHSDADVALHAITDALLGTIGAGDIGMHFPPSDPKWRGAASAQF